MVSNIKRFEYILTDSELEALILECNLIKEYRPKYNTMLMDDKTYPYVMVTLREDYPRILLARRMKKDNNKYFGPFTSAGAVRDTIDLLQKMYKIRNCNKTIIDNRKPWEEQENNRKFPMLMDDLVCTIILGNAMERVRDIYRKKNIGRM